MTFVVPYFVVYIRLNGFYTPDKIYMCSIIHTHTHTHTHMFGIWEDSSTSF